MYILGVNENNNKKLIIANKYKSVIQDSFSLLKNKEIEYESHHLYPFLAFLKDLELKSIKLSLIDHQELKKVKNISVLFSQDVSEEILKLLKELKLRESIFSIISIVEHPNFQKKNFIRDMNFFDLKISPFQIHYEQIKTINAYIYKTIPTIENQNELIIKNHEIIDSNIICSNLYTLTKSNYAFRRHAINVLSSLGIIDFKWFGRGWQINRKNFLTKKGLKYLRSSIFSWPKLTKNALKTYGGELINKRILYKCKTSISIENHSWPKGYVTEKFIEPLIYNCIPIYCVENFDDEILNYIKLDSSNNFVSRNMEEIIRSLLHYKDLSIENTKKESSIIRDRLNKYIKDSYFKTNLFEGFRVIMDKLS